MNLLFDLDGTLADPFEAFASSIVHAFNLHHLPIPSNNQLRSCIGPPLHLSMHEILGVAKERVAQIMNDYRDHHGKIGIFQYAFYPPAESVLKLLVNKHRLFVATSKPWPYAKTILQHFKMNQYFQEIYGSEMDGVRSNKAELLKYILEKEKLAPLETVMIGDREHDVIAAQKNQLRSIGVLWGFGDQAELLRAGADELCAQYGELISLIER